MTSLSTATEVTRKILFWGGAILGGLLLIAIIIMIGKSIKDRFFPSPPPPPTVSYGQLPQLTFPKGQTISNAKYTINTVSGFLPSLPDRAKVFQLAVPTAGLLSLDRAKDIANKLGFVNEPTAQSETSYAFTTDTPIAETLTMSLDTLNFSLTSNYLQNTPGTSLPAVPTDTAITLAQNFFENASMINDNIDLTSTKTTGFIYNDQNLLVPADNVASAQILYVDFIHKNIDDTSFVYAHPPHSNLSTTIAIVNNTPVIVAATGINSVFDPKQFGTYPIKSSKDAFTDLQNGNVYIAVWDGKTTQIAITNVSLAYYMPEDEYGYIVPVIVFTNNDNSFVAYVSAVTSLLMKNGDVTPTVTQ